jgi:porphobilinogen synthase
MVKPTMPYLDIIADAAELTPNHPIVACYQVSGEFAMVHAGAAAVVYDLKTMMFVSVEGMVRALAGTVFLFRYSTNSFTSVYPSSTLLLQTKNVLLSHFNQFVA